MTSRRASGLRLNLLACAVFLGLGACGSPYASYPRAKALAESPDEAVAFLSDKTVRTYNRYHGTQFEYLGRDGTSLLVYPGNLFPVPGHWIVRGSGEFDADMCFLYGANTWSPVTHESGGAWECRSLTRYLYELDTIHSGNVFQLASGKPFPRILPKDIDVSMATALDAIGLAVPKEPNLALSKARR